MKVELNQEAMQLAFQGAMESALNKSLESYSIQNDLQNAVTESIQGANLPELLRDALDARINQLSDEIVRKSIDAAIPAFELALSYSVRMMAAKMVYGLRKDIPSWDENEKKLFRECVEMTTNQTSPQ